MHRRRRGAEGPEDAAGHGHAREGVGAEVGIGEGAGVGDDEALVAPVVGAAEGGVEGELGAEAAEQEVVAAGPREQRRRARSRGSRRARRCRPRGRRPQPPRHTGHPSEPTAGRCGRRAAAARAGERPWRRAHDDAAAAADGRRRSWVRVASASVASGGRGPPSGAGRRPPPARARAAVEVAVVGPGVGVGVGGRGPWDPVGDGSRGRVEGGRARRRPTPSLDELSSSGCRPTTPCTKTVLNSSMVGVVGHVAGGDDDGAVLGHDRAGERRAVVEILVLASSISALVSGVIDRARTWTGRTGSSPVL